MKKNKVTLAAAILLASMVLFSGCKKDTKDNSKNTAAPKATAEAVQTEAPKASIEDGTYLADFKTDNRMFSLSEACDGKGTLTVKDGIMTIHISLKSKNIVNLYPGLAEDAQKEGAELLQPVVDTVTFSDGLTDEVNGFDVVVPYLDDEFDLAIIGTKGKWYDHKVSVSNPQKMSLDGLKSDIADGKYTIEAVLEGGSGKATITSPATINVKEGIITATIEWSSPNYDYMIVNGEKYMPVNTEGNSVFEIPVSVGVPVDVIADTVAMSKPHEIEYTITLNNDTLTPAE